MFRTSVRARRGYGDMRLAWIGYVLVKHEGGSYNVTCGGYRTRKAHALEDARQERMFLLEGSHLNVKRMPWGVKDSTAGR